MGPEVIHTGRRSWWDGSVTTLCGLKFNKDAAKEAGWLASPTCPTCKALKNRR
jgi:hypothetical protein